MTHRLRTALLSVTAAAAFAASGLGAGAANSSEDSVAAAPAVVAVASKARAVPSGCERTDHPSARRYASGAECAPEGFPYEPVMKSTKAGMRALDPHDDGCSKVADRGLTFDFRNACATHDYLADLQRFGAPGVPEASMDHQFLRDMRADCKKRNLLSRADCEATALAYRAGVQEGNYATGDEIDGG